MPENTAQVTPIERYSAAKRNWITYILCAGIITMIALPFAFARFFHEPWFGPALMGWFVVFIGAPGYVSFRHVDRLYALAFNPERES